METQPNHITSCTAHWLASNTTGTFLPCFPGSSFFLFPRVCCPNLLMSVKSVFKCPFFVWSTQITLLYLPASCPPSGHLVPLNTTLLLFSCNHLVTSNKHCPFLLLNSNLPAIAMCLFCWLLASKCLDQGLVTSPQCTVGAQYMFAEWRGLIQSSAALSCSTEGTALLSSWRGLMSSLEIRGKAV